ncbi:hypothetical protein ACFS7Z_25050 [Pontibacter toksunensis]|uniref:Uncharacterized protein n=1 Tax=Pontibacter toksunensis TaxID=1332631 RepID=A0ABW6C5B5_9BACT
MVLIFDNDGPEENRMLFWSNTSCTPTRIVHVLGVQEVLPGTNIFSLLGFACQLINPATAALSYLLQKLAQFRGFYNYPYGKSSCSWVKFLSM